MTSQCYILADCTDLYILLDPKAQNLTDSEKMVILLEIEQALAQANFAAKHLNLLWDNGLTHGKFTIWSVDAPIKVLSADEKQQLIAGSTLSSFVLPDYLQQRAQEDQQLMVFPEEYYIKSLLNLH
ncbi:hypothetical protein [Acinetobacter sp. A2]|uniref:hypothetical protein n=1 Tax=Acinetobacter sp. A2 TaxID=362457 RepID=UPI003AF37776